MQSIVIGIPYPSSMSEIIALSTCSRASGCRADLWFPRLICVKRSSCRVSSGRSGAG